MTMLDNVSTRDLEDELIRRANAGEPEEPLAETIHKLSVYYKCPKNTLHNVDVGSKLFDIREAIKEAEQAVLEHLHNTKETYKKPVLVVLDGGKS